AREARTFGKPTLMEVCRVGLMAYCLAFATGCKPRPAVRAIAIEEPTTYWRREGFRQMIPPVRLPTSIDGKDEIAVWIRIPDRAKLDLSPSLRYPAGTVVDRVESNDGAVSDVRGVRFLDDRSQEFHVLRPRAQGLAGFSWPRDRGDLHQVATS